MSALSAMQEKTQHLENSLSAETRIKLDLFSALGDAKRQLEIAQGRCWLYMQRLVYAAVNHCQNTQFFSHSLFFRDLWLGIGRFNLNKLATELLKMWSNYLACPVWCGSVVNEAPIIPCAYCANHNYLGLVKLVRSWFSNVMWPQNTKKKTAHYLTVLNDLLWCAYSTMTVSGFTRHKPNEWLKEHETSFSDIDQPPQRPDFSSTENLWDVMEKSCISVSMQPWKRNYTSHIDRKKHEIGITPGW